MPCSPCQPREDGIAPAGPRSARPATHASAASRQSCIFFVLPPELRLTCLHSLLLNLDSITTSQIVPHSSVYFSLPAAILIMLKFPPPLNFLLFFARFLFTQCVCRRDNFGALSPARPPQNCAHFTVTHLNCPPVLHHLPLTLFISPSHPPSTLLSLPTSHPLPPSPSHPSISHPSLPVHIASSALSNHLLGSII